MQVEHDDQRDACSTRCHEAVERPRADQDPLHLGRRGRVATSVPSSRARSRSSTATRTSAPTARPATTGARSAWTGSTPILAKSPAHRGSRAADPVVNWLTQVGEEGDEVVVVIEAVRAIPLRTAAQRPVVDARRRTSRGQVPRVERGVPRPADAARRSGGGRGDARSSPRPVTNWRKGSPAQL